MWSGYSEEGTGSQERGPRTFALQQPGAQEARAGRGQPVAVQGGTRGGGSNLTAPTVQISDSADRTLQQLLKVGEQLLAPSLQQMQQEKFLEGVTAAASGKAIEEIIAEQPWYSRIFGDGPLIEGARTYTVQAKVDQWASQLEQQMPELRKRGPGEIPGMLTESFKAFSTGDAATDAALQMNMVKAVPTLIKRHTKEHYQYLQEQAYDAMSGAVMTAGQRYRDAVEGGDKYSPEDRQLRGQELLTALTPPEGMDPTAVDKLATNAVSLYAEQGNFHAIKVLRDAGVINAMKPEDQLKVERAINQFGDYHRTRGVGGEMLLQYATVEARLHAPLPEDALSGEQYLAEVQKINAEYAARTGNPMPLVNLPEQARGVQTAAQLAYSAQRQELARVERARASARTELDKAAAKEASLSFWTQQALAGTIGTALSAHEGKKADADAGFVNALNNAPGATPQEQAANRVRLVVNAAENGYTNPELKNRYQQGLRSLPDVPTDQFKQAYQKWAELNAHPDSAAARAGYFGDEMDARLSAFHSLMQGQPATAMDFAYTAAMKRPLARSELTKDERAQVAKVIGSEVGRFFPGRLGNTSLAPGSAGMIEREIQQSLSMYKGMVPELGIEELANRALKSALANGLEVYGGHAWKTPQGLAKPLREVLPRVDGKDVIPESEVGDLFNAALAAQTKAYLGDKVPERVVLQRQPDQGNTARWSVWYSGAEGLSGSFPLDSELIVAEHAKRRELKLRQPERQAGDLPDITSPRTMFRRQ